MHVLYKAMGKKIVVNQKESNNALTIWIELKMQVFLKEENRS